MKGYRFYLEYSDPAEKKKPGTEGEHTGNVLALLVREDGAPYSHPSRSGIEYEGIGALSHKPNSSVGPTNVGHDHLEEKCKRISEAKAREIHPRLFKALEPTEGNPV